ncbi:MULTISPECIES: enoyl-CoA hydratase/isomerase family protein [Acidiplasma]|jgi:enoyl-CoA hydratase/carnithine racemase|uniref:Enoyl-CoA hydratase n=1 Tax=Acidiplasma aeolicum TaxID=507754 RepID=A0A0Q0VTH7_9ARCH|nr:MULTISPECIES: enoyl-CoA hydratase/isomerase family protein [Acidiplasma]KJE49893.1 hypothetical protein TZ01_02100 [Acidiplasma sp. MBA-1]KPV44027.1 hypothetical protein SE19_08895 [Acidiplasma aeolicum]KQB34849.1 hypothetical protein AOG54_03560 [Acidiplasma aeolicum]WMT55072.1 MAG: enoyl-CoA hydratase/isomerase family protein [Acidiplasma sp.]
MYNNIDLVSGDVSIIYFKREEKLNTLTLDMVNDIKNAMEEVKDTARCVIIEGKRNFSAGADIKQFRDLNPIDAYSFHRKLNELAFYFRDYNVPVISVLNGYVLGGGLELSLSTDIRVCSKNAQLGQPEINIGVNAGAGGNVILPHVIGRNRALYMILTGEKIDAQTAYNFGLVDIISDDAHNEALRIASMIAKKPIETVIFAKRAVNKSFMNSINIDMDYEASLFGLLFSSGETRKKINEFFNKK